MIPLLNNRCSEFLNNVYVSVKFNGCFVGSYQEFLIMINFDYIYFSFLLGINTLIKILYLDVKVP